LQYFLPTFTDPEIKLQKYLQLTGTTKEMPLHKVRTDATKNFYKTMVRPVFLYGSEIWVPTATHYRSSEAAEMQLLRPLAGYSLLDQDRNEDIRQELDIPPVTEILANCRMAWYGHLQRTSINRIFKRLLNYRPTGRSM
jgi:hypothetical protein